LLNAIKLTNSKKVVAAMSKNQPVAVATRF